MEAFKKNSKQFWCIDEKTGSGGGVNYPSPLATRGLMLYRLQTASHHVMANRQTGFIRLCASLKYNMHLFSVFFCTM